MKLLSSILLMVATIACTTTPPQAPEPERKIDIELSTIQNDTRYINVGTYSQDTIVFGGTYQVFGKVYVTNKKSPGHNPGLLYFREHQMWACRFLTWQCKVTQILPLLQPQIIRQLRQVAFYDAPVSLIFLFQLAQ